MLNESCEGEYRDVTVCGSHIEHHSVFGGKSLAIRRFKMCQERLLFTYFSNFRHFDPPVSPALIVQLGAG